MGKKGKKNKQPAAGAVTQKNGKGGAKRNRGGTARGRGNFRGRGTQRNPKQNGIPAKSQAWRLNRNQNQNVAQRGGGFVQKRYNKNGGLTRSRSNLNLAANWAMPNNNIRGAGASRRGRGGRGLNRSRSRTNLNFAQQYIATTNNNNNHNNKNLLKRTNSMPNLRDPTSVHNRLGYQSPAQVAYRNRVKRAKQLLLQRHQYRVSIELYYFVQKNVFFDQLYLLSRRVPKFLWFDNKELMMMLTCSRVNVLLIITIRSKRISTIHYSYHAFLWKMANYLSTQFPATVTKMIWFN